MTRLSQSQDQPRIRTAEQAIDRATQFLKAHGYYTTRPTSVQKEGDYWVTLFDVSFIGPRKIISLNIEAETGDIVGFEDKGTE